MRILLLLTICAAGLAQEPIRLVVRGDDFGYTQASNRAMERAFSEGVMTSASVLVPGPWFRETVAMLRGRPGWSVGVHLTITSEWNRLRWRSVSPITAVPSLVAPDGYLWGFGYSGPKPKDWATDGAPWAEHAPNPQEAETEFRAQIERALSLGVKLDYVDCHMGMACRENLLPITKKLAAEYCLGISGAGDFHEKRAQPKYPDDTRAGIKAGLLEMIESLTPGLWLYVGHPAAASEELRAVDSNSGERWALRRSSVLAAWTDPEVRASIERRGIILVSYRELGKDRTCQVVK